jgi:hypothetical protein
MEIPARRYWCWEERANGVYSLENSLYITTTGDLLDEDRREAF